MIQMLFTAALLQTGKPIETDIAIGGAPSAKNVYVVRSDSTIESTTEGTIQGVELKSKLIVKFSKGEPVSLDFNETLTKDKKILQGMTATVENGKAKFTLTGQKPQEAPTKLTLPMMGNFHPQLLGSVAKLVDWNTKKPAEFPLYLVNNLAALPVKVTPIKSQDLDIGGAKTRVWFSKIKIATTEGELVLTEDGKVVGLNIPSQKFQQILSGVKNVFQDPLASYPELSQRSFDTISEIVDIPMRDGTTLKTNITRPKSNKKFPTVLARTPYGRDSGLSEADDYARRGYVSISQDVRGTGSSKGEFDPFIHESKDGYDTIDWISKQPWSDGGVGMIGASYVGYVQWAAAVENHPALKCILPQVSPPASAMWNLPYENGVFFMLGNLWWLRLVDDPKGMNMMGAFESIKNLQAITTLPLSQVDNKVLGWNSKNFDRWLTRETSKDWAGWDFESKMADVKIPVLHISGWFDGDEIGTQRNWQMLKSAGHKRQWLLYGPWTHGFNTTTKIGDEDFGSRAKLELESLYVRWFDTWLKGKSVGIENISQVKYFAMGANRWKESTNWPPAESKEEVLEFEFEKDSMGGRSNSKLVSRASRDSSVRYTYDPSKDRVSKNAIDFADDSETMHIQPEKIDKSLVVLKSEPLDSDKLVAGNTEVEFDFTCSAKDTDFYVSMYAVQNDGRFFPITRPGKFRAAYLSGTHAVTALTPGKTYRAKFQLWDSAYQFRKGERIAITINSSMFPMTARNLGTAEPIATGTKMMKQVNTILSGPASPGRLRFWAQ
jgi:uncharacterized protein